MDDPIMNQFNKFGGLPDTYKQKILQHSKDLGAQQSDEDQNEGNSDDANNLVANLLDGDSDLE